MENRIIELLNKLPYKIEHKILDSWFDNNNVFVHGWTEDKKTLRFELTKTDKGLFVAQYVNYGFEGEKNRLPLKDNEIEELMKYGCIFTEPEAKPLEIALENLYNWLVKENLVNEENIGE